MSDETKLIIKWGKPEVVTPSLLCSAELSVATGADIPGDTAFPLSALFDGASVSLPAQPPMVGEQLDDRMYAVWAGAFRVPVEIEQQRPGVWFKSDLRCFLHKDEDTRALLVADLGGEQVVREFAYGRSAVAEEFVVSVVQQAETLPPAAYAASLFLIVERHNHESGVDLRIDSLDVEVNPNFRA